MSLGFNQQDTTNIKIPIVPIEFKNAICYGQTGSGKTTGFMLPNIKNRVHDGHGLLIYDFKGNLHLQIKQLAKEEDRLEDIVEIGKPWGKSTNILNGISPQQLRKIYNLFQGGNQNVGSHEYWKNASGNLLENMFGLYISIHKLINNKALARVLSSCNLEYKEDLSVKVLFNIMKSPNDLSQFICYCETIVLNIYSYCASSDKTSTILPLIQDAMNYIESLKDFKSMKTPEEVSGKYGVLSCLNTIFSAMATNTFLNTNEIDVVDALNKGKIIIVNTSSMSEETLMLFNIAIYSRLSERIAVHSNPIPVTVFIDEAQKVLSHQYLPDVDICRENRFEYILATQDWLLLANKIGHNKTEEFTRNLSSSFSFKTNDSSDTYQTDTLEQFEYIDHASLKKYKAEPIFFSINGLELLEQHLQIQSKAFKGLERQTNKKLIILMYNARLAQEYKVITKNITNGETKIVPYVFNKHLLSLDDIYKPYHKELEEENSKDAIIEQLEKEKKTLYKQIDIQDEEIKELKERIASMSPRMKT